MAASGSHIAQLHPPLLVVRARPPLRFRTWVNWDLPDYRVLFILRSLEAGALLIMSPVTTELVPPQPFVAEARGVHIVHRVVAHVRIQIARRYRVLREEPPDLRIVVAGAEVVQAAGVVARSGVE